MNSISRVNGVRRLVLSKVATRSSTERMRTVVTQQRTFFSPLSRVLRGGSFFKPSSEEITVGDDMNDDLNARKAAKTKNIATEVPVDTMFPVSVHSIQGHREYMEDNYAISKDFVALFDGHGGAKVSQYLRQNLYAALKQTNVHGDPPTALHHAIHTVNEEICRIMPWSFQGSTGIMTWIVDGTLYTANVGDSRAVLSHRGQAVALSKDHKPTDPSEYERIHQAGGFVSRRLGDIPRVNGNLALSRAFGDRAERPAVIADPDISVLELDDACDFVVLGTDGVWDVMSSYDVVEFVKEARSNGAKTEDIAAMIVHESLLRGSYDNISAIVVFFDMRRTGDDL